MFRAPGGSTSVALVPGGADPQHHTTDRSALPQCHSPISTTYAMGQAWRWGVDITGKRKGRIGLVKGMETVAVSATRS